jgi:molybdopterin molybdotransferase
MVNFFQFVRPLLRRMLGDPEPFLPVLRATLDRPHRRRPDRPELIRARLHVHDGHIRASVIGHQGSGNLAGMARAHGFLLAPADATELSGEVHVQVFDPSFLSAPAARYPWADAAPPDGSPDKCC